MRDIQLQDNERSLFEKKDEAVVEQIKNSLRGFFMGEIIGKHLEYFNKSEISKRLVDDAMRLTEGKISKEAEINNYILNTLGEDKSGALDIQRMLLNLNQWYQSVGEADIAIHYTNAFED